MKALFFVFLFTPILVTAKQLTLNIFEGEKQQELLCLSKNVFFEADSQGVLGQRAVAWVTMNRVKSKGWLSSVCGVVYQPSFDPKRPYGCQFSWTCAKQKRKIKKEDNLLFDNINIIAYRIYSGIETNDITEGATYYVRCEILNTNLANFLRDAIFTVRINDHCFFKDKKKGGQLAAFFVYACSYFLFFAFSSLSCLYNLSASLRNS